MSVREFNDDATWLEARKKIVTATEMPCVLGLDKYKSAEKMFRDKGGGTFFGNAYTTIGQLLEPVVVSATNLMLNTDFQLYDQQAHKVMYINDDIGMGATPDAYSKSLDCLLECKTTLPHNYRMWHDHPPVKYLVQLHTQMICTGIDVGYLSIMSTNLAQSSPVLDMPLSVHKVYANDLISDYIKSEVVRFWETKSEGKVFRSRKKDSELIELYIRMNMEKIL